jgi:8-oxo-dGTP pyrophosphatase MutT (NUDIX family)
MSSYDVVDQDDNPTGRIASYDEVNAEGLWHRGVHVIIYTPEGEILMQKRSINLAFHPGEIEISVGGGVDAGETPEEAVLREAREEMGLNLKQEDLRFLGKQIYNYHLKNQIKRVHNYSYAICIDKTKLQISRNASEVDAVFFIKKSQLKRALTLHRIKNLGKISGQYAYWKTLVASI